MVDWTANAEIFATVSVLGIGVILALIAAISYQRLRNPRSLLIGLGFLTLALKGGYMTMVSWQSRGAHEWLLPIALLDLVLALLFYSAIRKP
jgi:hypothetical protein